jgi:hypothetical protein
VLVVIPLERQTADASRLNALLNDPRVRPWIANGDQPVDVTPQVSNPKHVFLLGDHGACCFLQLMPALYEAHTAVLPEYRGEWTNQLTEAAVNHMFLATDAYEIVTRVPKGHIGARTAAVTRGTRYEMTRENECVFMDRRCDVHLYSFRLQDWIVTADFLEEMGERFHDALHAEADRLGIQDKAHAPDPNHNKYVGAAIAMARNGQARKAAIFYNRWAVMCRHQPIALLEIESHPVIRIDHGLTMKILPDSIEVTRS